MFGLGGPEIIIIMLVGLVLFGAQRLPELGRGLGEGLREFKKSTRELREDFDLGLNDVPAKPAQRLKVKDAVASERPS